MWKIPDLSYKRYPFNFQRTHKIANFCLHITHLMLNQSYHSKLQVWNLFKKDRLTESVDPCLKGNFPPTETSKVLKIGLLCAQASLAQRPSMVDVVRMLTEENCPIPEPRQPPFINTSALSVSSTRSSYSINSSTSNQVTKQETSYPSTETESFSIQSSDGQSRSTEEITKIVGN